MASNQLDLYFEGKPAAREIFETIRAKIDAATPNTVAVGSQVTFGTRRKFA